MARTEAEMELLTPVATELGLHVIEWNDLCDSLGYLFATIADPGHLGPNPPALDSWPCRSDKVQRKMLREEALKRKHEAENTFPKFGDDLAWLCDCCDRLADHRNDVVHAPLTFLLDEHGQAVSVTASVFFGHPRAQTMDGKDLIAEFRTYTFCASALKFFARRIASSLRFGPTGWPERPSLPDLRPTHK
jgi:hypothetical protein